MGAALLLLLAMIGVFFGIYAALVEICGPLASWIIATALSVGLYTRIIARR